MEANASRFHALPSGDTVAQYPLTPSDILLTHSDNPAFRYAFAPKLHDPSVAYCNAVAWSLNGPATLPATRFHVETCRFVALLRTMIDHDRCGMCICVYICVYIHIHLLRSIYATVLQRPFPVEETCSGIVAHERYSYTNATLHVVIVTKYLQIRP